MVDILAMNREQLLALDPKDVTWLITAAEFEHIAKELGALWLYNYVALKAGKPGRHALLKSELHSDGFFVSKILLAYLNIRTIMARQIIVRLNALGIPTPDYVAGIPDGAKLLGEAVGEMMGVPVAEMVKDENSRIKLVTPLLGRRPRVLPIEDFCTRGTGLKEGVLDIHAQAPHAEILPYDPVLLNRGGLTEVIVPGLSAFQVVAVVERRVQDWKAEVCPLCAEGSEVIKPKATEENWRLINESQK